MFEYATIPTVSYTVAGIVKDSGLVDKRYTPLVALVVGLVYGSLIGISNGDGFLKGFMFGFSGWTATGAHETVKGLKGDNIETENLENMGNDVV